MEIGDKIRDLRQQKNLTQAELAARTDLTKGYISQLEHGQSSPALDTFLAILEVLGTTPDEFFKTKEKVNRLVYRRADVTITHDDISRYDLSWLVPVSNENEMEPVLLRLAAAGEFKQFPPSRAETFAYVLKGQVGLRYGAETYSAKTGESFYYTAEAAHQFFNQASTESEILIVATRSYL